MRDEGAQSSEGASLCVDDFFCLEHGVSDDRGSARHSYRSAPEAQPLAEREPPIFVTAQPGWDIREPVMACPWRPDQRGAERLAPHRLASGSGFSPFNG